MRTVRNAVDTGGTVLCTIHQTSIEMFEAFDELLPMKRGETSDIWRKAWEKVTNYEQLFSGFRRILLSVNSSLLFSGTYHKDILKFLHRLLPTNLIGSCPSRDQLLCNWSLISSHGNS